MRIALVHDYIKEYGGAERVLEALHELYPNAPVFTTVYLPEFLGPHRDRFNPPAGGWDIRESWVRLVPFRAKLISPLRILSPLIFRSFDLSEFDVVIVSATGAYFPNSIRIRNQESGIRRAIHICYCHTPPRYLYGYATAREWKKNIMFRVLGEIANHILRMVDYYSSKNVDYFIANSINVQKRIEKFYRRDSIVIYPPVDMPESGIRNPRFAQASRGEQESGRKNHNSRFMIHDSYYLAGGRLARPKHIDLIVKTCQKLGLPLKVFGKGFAGYESELGIRNNESGKKNHNSKVEFVGEVTDEEKFELMKNAKVFIFAAEDEDFGITPVEAMAAGTPVIAYRSGGVVESVVDGKTGVFFDELTVESLSKAIQKFNSSNYGTFNRECVERAEKFSKERFKTEIQLFVNRVYKKNF